MKDNFSTDQGEWDDFEMIQSLYLLCTLFLLLYILIYNEIIIQLTILKNQGALSLFFYN